MIRDTTDIDVFHNAKNYTILIIITEIDESRQNRKRDIQCFRE